MIEQIITKQIKEAQPLIFLNPRKFLLSELIALEIFAARMFNVLTLGMFGISEQVELNLKHQAKLDI